VWTSNTGLKPSKPPGFSEDEAWARTAQLLAKDDASISRPAALAITEADNGDLQVRVCVW
jgi:hypothetical protein